jgi:hypothetical protein
VTQFPLVECCLICQVRCRVRSSQRSPTPARWPGLRRQSFASAIGRIVMSRVSVVGSLFSCLSKMWPGPGSRSCCASHCNLPPYVVARPILVGNSRPDFATWCSIRPETLPILTRNENFFNRTLFFPERPMATRGPARHRRRRMSALDDGYSPYTSECKTPRHGHAQSTEINRWSGM